jgi:predicted O-methyltransferase YrrM
MKLHNSTVLNNLSKFQCNHGAKENLMRDREGVFITWKTVEYFQPKSILEIGFGCGETLGILFEAAGDNCQRIVSNDIDYKNQKEQFHTLFPNNQIEFIETASKNLKLNETFDFILIDGDHRYESVVNDINVCLPLLHKNSILCLDDYYFESVDCAVQNTLINNSDFVPFLSTTQQIFFHHETHSVEDFLDNWLINVDKRFMQYTPRNYHGFEIVNGHLYDIMFIENNKIFQLALEFFNL